MNRRLEDMIRQGREALGTRVEVDGEGGDEQGWSEDDDEDGRGMPGGW